MDGQFGASVVDDLKHPLQVVGSAGADNSHRAAQRYWFILVHKLHPPTLSEATDGRFANWNHAVAVRGEAPRSYPGGDDIGSNFYPSLGCYRVNDPNVLRQHMRQLCQAGVGVICASWWGRDTFTDRALA